MSQRILKNILINIWNIITLFPKIEKKIPKDGCNVGSKPENTGPRTSLTFRKPNFQPLESRFVLTSNLPKIQTSNYTWYCHDIVATITMGAMTILLQQYGSDNGDNRKGLKSVKIFRKISEMYFVPNFCHIW